MIKALAALKGGRSAAQLWRYALVGVASNAAGYLVYLLAVRAGAAPTTAMTILYAIGAAAGFAGNRRLTFAHNGSLMGAGARYLLAHACGYLINLAILVLMVRRHGYPHQLAQAVAVVVVAAFLFIALKFFVFTPQPGDTP
ncbi:GtrA family protein [Janthinobacterium sp.]|uniref:GtrA family protein n=1 Tax=Janthinobacterium sp. TaxID=1871054 RepID=UPI00293D4B73|nr:GtrA family protein [Janthinobacterium sp.]